jgi:hypothetical protein
MADRDAHDSGRRACRTPGLSLSAAWGGPATLL